MFDATSNTIVTLMTSGTVTASVAWAVNEDGVPLVPLPSPGRVSNLFTYVFSTSFNYLCVLICTIKI